MQDGLLPEQRATLRTLTFGDPPANTVDLARLKACTGQYECICDTCTAERIRRVKRGIRPSSPIPTRVARRAA